MTFAEFTYHHWDVLIKYISAYYPLSHPIIEQYRYDLNWSSISTNAEIEWTFQFIEDNKDNLIWHLLSVNPGVPLTEEFIKTYKKRLDWDYLPHNPALPLTDSFIEACGRSFKVAETNSNINNSFREAHADKIVPRLQPPPKPEGLEDCSLENFNANWKNWKYNLYPEIYKKIIEPNLPNDSILVLLNENIPQPGKFVYFSASQKDEFGLITSFQSNPKNAIDLVVKGNTVTCIEFTQSNLQEGKDRVYDFVRISNQGYPCLLLSQSALKHFQLFNLPEFQLIKAELKTKKLDIRKEYYLLIFKDNTLINECGTRQKFEFYFKRSFESGPKRAITGENKSFHELKAEVKDIYAESFLDILEFYPKDIEIKSKLDLFTLNGKIIISTRLREFIINSGFGPCDFQSTIPMALTSKVNFDSVVIGQKTLPNHPSTHEDDIYTLKMQRLEESDPPFSRIEISEDRMSRVERKLNVIFPKEFRKHYLNSRIIFDNSMMSEEFGWLPIESFFIENSYADRYPESFKSCVVAENGSGDYIGMLLEKFDDYNLNEELVVLKHETGEIQKGKIQITSPISNGG